ncbi:MAG: hypothetical protein ACFFD9_10830 [Candidatus Thorarchaeota archaeon]
MTEEPPYWTDPLKAEFPVTIIACDKVEGQFATVISEEVVRPAAGGQAGDRGKLLIGNEEVRFTDAASIEGRLSLITDQQVPPGTVANLIVDLDWRKAMMRNHTSEHLLVASIKKKHHDVVLGYMWIDGEHGTVDLGGRELELKDLIQGEDEVQGLIEDELPVETDLVKASEVSSDVRAREGVSEKHQVIRVVKVGEFDSSACSGTHVANTRDIGVFKIIDFKAIPEGLRVEFVAGRRAREELTRTYNELLSRKHAYPFEIGQVGAVLDKARISTSQRKQLIDKVEQLITEGPTMEEIANVRFLHEYMAGFDSKAMRMIVKKIRLEGPSAALLYSPSRKPTFILWTNELVGEAKDYVQETVEQLGGKGGGSRDVYTGGFAEVDSPEETYDQLVAGIRKSLIT